MVNLPVQNHMQKGLVADLAMHAPGKVPSSEAELIMGFFFGMVQKCSKISLAVTNAPVAQLDRASAF
jgi:hypothetical protein